MKKFNSNHFLRQKLDQMFRDKQKYEISPVTLHKSVQSLIKTHVCIPGYKVSVCVLWQTCCN